jgi:hypothetical protein
MSHFFLVFKALLGNSFRKPETQTHPTTIHGMWSILSLHHRDSKIGLVIFENSTDLSNRRGNKMFGQFFKTCYRGLNLLSQ